MVLDMLGQPLSRKNGGSYILHDKKTNIATNLPLSSFFINNGLQRLTITVSINLCESLGHICNPRYLKAIILAFFGYPRLTKNGHFGVFCYYS